MVNLGWKQMVAYMLTGSVVTYKMSKNIIRVCSDSPDDRMDYNVRCIVVFIPCRDVVLVDIEAEVFWLPSDIELHRKLNWSKWRECFVVARWLKVCQQIIEKRCHWIFEQAGKRSDVASQLVEWRFKTILLKAFHNCVGESCGVGSSSPDRLALFRSQVIENVFQSCGMIGISVDDGITVWRSSASWMFQCIALCFQI